MRGLDAGGRVQQDATQVRGRAGAGRAEVQLALVGLGIGNELLKVARRQVLVGHQHQRHLGDQDHRIEIGNRVVLRLGIERLVLGVRADGAEHELTTVLLALGDAAGAGHAPGAADVLDDHRLAQRLAHALPDDAAQHVGRPPGSERDHHRHRAGGIGLRRGDAGERQ